MIQREITKNLERALEQNPAVALLGPRQIGKTTLALTIAEKRPSLYLDLESTEDLLKLRDARAYLSSHNDKLIILDEIQRAPDIFKDLRGLIDQKRQTGKPFGQFLLLGSASMELMRQSSESLAGRIHYLDMSGFNLLETAHNNAQDIQALWFRGGFPQSYLARTDNDSMQWLEMLIRTYLERDIPQLGFRISSTRLRRLWTMLAHLQGETLNYSKLGSNLEVDSKTVTHYLDILVDLLLLRRLQPWYANVKKRLIKSPRFYIRDSGIMHRLLAINHYDSLLSNPVLGKSWEGFVIENILSLLPITVEPYFYRTASGTEIDLVLKFSDKDLWAIEIKHGLAPKIKSSFHQACEDIGATQKFVVYSGTDDFPIEKQTKIVSLAKMMVSIKKQVGIATYQMQAPTPQKK